MSKKSRSEKTQASRKEFVSRLRPLVDRSRKTQQAIEAEAGLSTGALNHMLQARRGPPRADALARLASVLGSDYEHLAVGKEKPEGALRAPVPGLTPTLDEMEGYANVEIVVGRLEPKIPLDVFEQVRKIRFLEPPIPLTVDFVRGLAVLMTTRANVVDETEQIRSKTDAKSAGSSASKRPREANRAR